MTALNFLLSDKQVIIATDTLAVGAEDGCPHHMSTKVLTLPHLRMCVTATGAMVVLQEFGHLVNGGAVVKDIRQLDRHATEVLQEIQGRFVRKYRQEISTTIYTFGWCNKSLRFCGYAYRSTEDYESEELQLNCFACKPPLNDMSRVPEIKELADFATVMRMQQEEDRAKLVQDRVGIGGEVVATTMAHNDIGGVAFHQSVLASLGYREVDWAVMLAKLPGT